MKTINLSKYGVVLTQAKMAAVKEEVQHSLMSDEHVVLDFSGVKGIDSTAARELVTSLRERQGGKVQFTNAEPMVKSVLIFSGGSGEPARTSAASPHATRRRSFSAAFSHIFATILLLLTLGVGQMWADKTVYFKWSSIPSWYTDIWKVQYWNGSSDVYVAISSAGVTDVYKATVADNATGWRICRWNGSNRHNDGAWCSLGTENMLVVNGVAANQSDAKNGDGPYGDKKSSVFGPIGGGYMLFDNSKTQWSDGYRYFVIGHDNGDGYYKTIGSNSGYIVANTLLWCFDANSETWYDAQYFAFLSHGGSYPTASKKWSDIDKWGANKTSQYTSTFTLKHDSIYLCVPASGTGKPTFTTTRQNGYSALNSTVTLRAKVSTNGGSTYSEANTPGDLSASSYKFSAWNTCGTQDATTTGSVSAGSASGTFTAGYTANTSVSAADVTGYDFVGWYEGSTLVLDGSRTGTMNPHGAVTLYAYYKVKQYTVSYGVYSSVNGSIQLNSGSAVTSSSSSTLNHGTSITFTATPSSGYQVDGWYSTSACNTTPLQEGGNTYNAGSLSAATTVYVKFKVRTGGTIALSAGTGGEVSADNSSWGTSKSHTNITSNSDLNIYARPTTGYTFNTWTKSSGSGTIKTNAASGVFTPVAYEDATLTASFNETMSSLSTSCSYDAGNPSYSAPSVTGSYTNVGYATTRSITAATPTTNYTFAGWTITNGARTDGGSETATTITVRSNGDGAAVSVVANYEEILTSRWHLVGKDVTSKVTFPDGWNVSSTSMMEKASGHADDDVVYGEVTVSNASGTYEFKVVDDDGANDDIWYGYSTGGTYLTWTATGTKTVYSGSGNSNNLKFTPTVAGTYTFKVDYSGDYPNVTITYPVSYTVTFGASPSAAADAPTNNASISSGDLVLSGTSVTFTKDATPNSGYSWKGWYDNEEGDGDALGTGNTYTTTISDDTEVYAVYDEDMHDIDVKVFDNDDNENTGGDVSATSVSAGIATASDEVTAIIDNEAWRFKYWIISDELAAADGYSTTTNPVKINTTASYDDDALVAIFEPRYGLVGSLKETKDPTGGMPGWGDLGADFEVIDFDGLGDDGVDLECARTLLPNKTYKFQVKDRVIGGGTNRGSTSGGVLPAEGENNWQLNGSADVEINTVGYGTYTFKITNISDDANRYPSVEVERPASYQITIGTKSVYNGGASSDASTTGGSVSAKTTENDPETSTPTDYPITTGQYIRKNGTAVFTASPATGYTFDGWYSDASCSSPYVDNSATTGTVVIDNEDKTLTLSSISDATPVYAKFTEIMTTVALSATNGKIQYWTGSAWADAPSSESVGVHTTCSLKVVPNTGYYFSEWTRTPAEGADFHLNGYAEANTNVTLNGDGGGETSGQTLTAVFEELDKIYFRNIFDDGEGNVTRWENVYVFFDITWADYSSKQAVKTSVNNSSKNLHVAMTKIGSSDVYWAYVPRYVTANSKANVAFATFDMDGNDYYFYDGNAAGRGDYNPLLNMFVPHHTKLYNTNSVDYYNNGYWMKYDTRASRGVGYYLKKYNKRNDYTQEGEFIATNDDATFIQFKLRIDAATSTTLGYMITSAGGLNYLADATITSSNCTNIGVSENTQTLTDHDVKFSLTTTSEGIYTFVLDQSGDKMKLNVIYPVSEGDYRLKHTYNDGTAKTTYSDVIKASDAAVGQTMSMYLSTEGTETLVLQKCTLITAGVPQWNAGDATNLGGILTTVGSSGNGVYQFDVAVNTSTDKVSSASSATKYTGPYYIKTDGATGGWANYKLNFMEENTLNYDKNNPDKSFNYYYCKYFNEAGSNLKCVIANDYCNALTDTLIGDAVIGAENQTTPSAASVRFSYNSYTNEIKRSYLGSSVSDDFLRIEGNTTDGQPHIYDKDETEFDDSHDDAYIKFEDKQNWRYEIVVNADVNARAKLTATFNSQTQYFMGAAGDFSDANTEQLFGGNDGNTYGLTLVYDFKTNKLIRAWKPTGSKISENLTLKSDVFLLREHQGAPAAITFGKIGDTDVYASLTEVKTVYSVLRFNRWKLSNRAHPEDVNTEHCKTPALINEHHPALAVNQDDANGKWLPQAERELYFISFPYDVKMSDIIHFGGYYDTWGIMYYDGKGRAKNGYWIDSESNWKYFTPEEFATKTLNAYEGYLIGIDLAAMAYNNTSFWTNNSSEVDIYFPSKTAVSTITEKAVTVTIDTVGYECKINRTFGGSDGDRRIKDSHWHCIGVPAYANLTQDETHTGAPDKDTDWKTDNLLYVYSWRPSTNDHVISDAGSFTFNAMYAYLVQYSQPTLSWAAASATGPASIAAKRVKTEELRDRQFNLQLLQGETEADHTYIRLSDDEEVTAGFEFNHDVSKMMLNGANIYTLIGTEQAAANSLPLNLEQTTVVPVGVKIATNGSYTFSMPEGTEGIGVFLIDNITGTRTNLGLMDYTTTLTAGTHNDRFTLEISPIQQVTTGFEAVIGNDSNARKVMIDGILYILKDGKVFDAQGRMLK